MKRIIHKIKVILPTLLILFTLGTQTVFPAVTFACGDGSNSPKQNVLSGVDQAGTNCSGSGVFHVISDVVNILSIVIGAAAVLMIVISGFKFVTSSGDSAKVASARSTLIYALVGVAVTALAQLLVHFVLGQAAII
ncbi:MAG: hypothetical protein ACHQT9_04545 [Candidatus Saccharimonadales bacterium]